MSVFAVCLPMPPSLSALTNNMAGPGRIKSKAYKEWQKGASAILRAAWRQQGSPKFQKHLSVIYRLGLGYRGDIANREKALTDLLVQTIPDFPDDRWIDHIEIERVETEDARIIVRQLLPPGQDNGTFESIGTIAARVVGDIEKRMAAGSLILPIDPDKAH